MSVNNTQQRICRVISQQMFYFSQHFAETNCPENACCVYGHLLSFDGHDFFGSAFFLLLFVLQFLLVLLLLLAQIQVIFNFVLQNFFILHLIISYYNNRAEKIIKQTTIFDFTDLPIIRLSRDASTNILPTFVTNFTLIFCKHRSFFILVILLFCLRG